MCWMWKQGNKQWQGLALCNKICDNSTGESETTKGRAGLRS